VIKKANPPTGGRKRKFNALHFTFYALHLFYGKTMRDLRKKINDGLEAEEAQGKI
jgi:hypothetical protein